MRCGYCGTTEAEFYEIDHRIPVSRGGSNDEWNLVVACRPCNAAKGTLTDTEFTGTPGRSHLSQLLEAIASLPFTQLVLIPDHTSEPQNEYLLMDTGGVANYGHWDTVCGFSDGYRRTGSQMRGADRVMGLFCDVFNELKAAPIFAAEETEDDRAA